MTARALRAWRSWLGGLAFAVCAAATAAPLPMLRAQGTQWVDPAGRPVALKGVNLGNWLLPEFWMMGQGSNGIDDQCRLEATLDTRFGRAERDRLVRLFRDHWITERDWDLIPRFGLNLVRVPFLWSVVEDEDHPRQLRADAWRYLDAAIDAAERRGLYVVLDLHGAVGSQGHEHHSGCAGQNQWFERPDLQERTAWLWEQVAARYRDRGTVAGYSLLNEPWGADEATMAAAVKALYARMRAVDPNHVIILPGHHRGIDAYGVPAEQGLQNVAFEMHPYPGHFGWDKPGLDVHRRWLRCEPGGTGGVCEWRARLERLQAPFFVGEFQPWADLDPELGGQITRLSYDTYAALGWASAAWSWKWLSNRGGPTKASWGLVTNAAGATLPALDFRSAPLADIERLFRRFGELPYRLNEPVLKWMQRAAPPDVLRRGAPPLARPAGYRLVWADEFARAGLPDARRWDHDTARNREGWWNREQQYYARERAANAEVRGGRLVITARRESLSDRPDWGGQPYSAARLVTRGRAEWTYGFFEVRAKLPCGRGTWPAIWTLGSGGRWPDDGELDILEQVGHRPTRLFSTVHTKAGSGAHGQGADAFVPDACGRFHDYQMLWTADAIRFGIDGVEHFRYARDGRGADAWPFDRPQYLILNIAIGGDLGGPVDDTIFPVTMEVEHVRVWQKPAR